MIIKIFTEHLLIVIAWGSSSPDQVLHFTNETYFPGQSENSLPACFNKRTAKRVCLTGGAHLSRSEDSLLCRTH